MSSGSGSAVVPLHRTNWPLLALSIVFSTCALLSKEQGVMVIGVCASYDVFVHWNQLWTIVLSKFRSSNIHTKQTKLKNDMDVADNNYQVSQDLSTSRNTTINGMTARLSNGSSKVKSANTAQSKSQRRDLKKDCNTNTMIASRAVFFRIGLILCF